MVNLSEKQKNEFLLLFPEEAPGMIERSDYDEIIDFLDWEATGAFVNDQPTARSNRIENLLDDINWTIAHGTEE